MGNYHKIVLALSLIWTSHPKEWTNRLAEPEKRIIWNQNTKLSWDNFKGKVPQNTPLVAETNSGIHFGYNCMGEKIEFNIYAYFDQELSWHKPKASKSAFKHEMLHFDISELYARKLRKRMYSLRHPCSMPKNEFQKIFNELVIAHKDRQKKYDLETKHSMDSLNQKNWEKWVAQELLYLSKFEESKN